MPGHRTPDQGPHLKSNLPAKKTNKQTTKQPANQKIAMKTSNRDHPIRNTLKHLALAGAFALGAGSAQAQIIEVGGAGAIGVTPLTTAQVPATPGGFAVKGRENGEAALAKDLLTTVADGDVILTINHTYHFEEGYDFGSAVLVINGGVQTAISITNGYESEPGGTGVWWAPQGWWSNTPKTVTSVMNFGNWPAGTAISVLFTGNWDGGVTEGPPAWVINTVNVTDGGANVLENTNFAIDGASGWSQYDFWNPDPPEYQWQQLIPNSKFEINADTLAADQYSLPSGLGTVIDLNNAKLSVVLLSGDLDPGDTFALFDLSSTTLTGAIASISLPIGTWDTTNLAVDGTITYSGPPPTPECPLGVLQLTANGGINPATGLAWAVGDTYRLAFVTSSATPVSSTDITTYNTFVQGVAAASTTFPNLGDGTWNVLGCTAAVNARVNTGTDSGFGESVILMDGTTVWANNRADIWNGIPERAPGQWLAPYMNENGVDVGNVGVFTGMTNGGDASDPLGNGAVQYGNTGGGGDNDDWTMVFNSSGSGRVYALSAPITLVAATVSTDDFTSWATTNGATGQTADQDHDNDGVENGVEYFMGQTGSSFTAMNGLDATNTIIWPASATYEGTYEVQTSPDLVTWTNVSPKPVPSGGNLSYTLPTGEDKLFLRLLVTPAP
jgi:hypothetical protein